MSPHSDLALLRLFYLVLLFKCYKLCHECACVLCFLQWWGARWPVWTVIPAGGDAKATEQWPWEGGSHKEHTSLSVGLIEKNIYLLSVFLRMSLTQSLSLAGFWVLQEKQDKVALLAEMANLRQNNQRLQEESLTTSEQLRKFSQMFNDPGTDRKWTRNEGGESMCMGHKKTRWIGTGGYSEVDIFLSLSLWHCIPSKQILWRCIGSPSLSSFRLTYLALLKLNPQHGCWRWSPVTGSSPLCTGWLCPESQWTHSSRTSAHPDCTQSGVSLHLFPLKGDSGAFQPKALLCPATECLWYEKEPNLVQHRPRGELASNANWMGTLLLYLPPFS